MGVFELYFDVLYGVFPCNMLDFMRNSSQTTSLRTKLSTFVFVRRVSSCFSFVSDRLSAPLPAPVAVTESFSVVKGRRAKRGALCQHDTRRCP